MTRPASGFIKHPTIVMAGSQHKSATSFKPKNIDMSERAKLYRDLGIFWISPTRGRIYTNVVCSWLAMQWPTNHFRSPLIATENMEVASAYNMMVKLSMSAKDLGQAYQPQYAKMFAECPFILTTEEDNVLPSDIVPKLLEAIMTCPDCGEEIEPVKWKCAAGHQGFDAVSGLYFIKTDPPIPMAFGKPTFREKDLNFHPLSVADAIKRQKVIECNGLAMGAALWRKDLFRRVKNTKRNPWFKTTPTTTQDLYFCKRAKLEAHARFGVHCGVRVGHYDPGTGNLY